jgi:hypothetical protein
MEPFVGFLPFAHILINAGGLRPRVHLELTNKNPKAWEYQSSAKVEEGLT